MDHKNFTNPTYLRSIYDGLSAGSINKDNATALPKGLVGIYEEALPPKSNVNERKKFLEFFGVWALLKKEVSLEFVLPLLEGWTEEDIVNYINRYSKWFNSPVSGKYILYHERLIIYLLQKVSFRELVKLNDKLIYVTSKLSNDEYTDYYLKFAYFHTWFSNVNNSIDNRFKDLIFDVEFAKRQFKHLSDYTPIYLGFNLALKYYGYKNDKVLYEVIKRSNQLVQNEFLIVEVLLENEISNLKESDLNKIHHFFIRIGERESYFQFLIFALAEIILCKSKDNILFDSVLLNIKEYLDSDTVPLDFYIPLINLVILIEFDEKRTEHLVFLLDYIYSFRLLNYFEIVEEKSIWAKFHHQKIYNDLDDKHIKRFFWIKENILPDDHNSILFITDIWENLSPIQKNFVTSYITDKDILLIKKKINHFINKKYICDLLLYLKDSRKITIEEINDIYLNILNNKTKSNFLVCSLSTLYINSELFEQLNNFEKQIISKSFIKRLLKVKSNKLFYILYNETIKTIGSIYVLYEESQFTKRIKKRLNNIEEKDDSKSFKYINKYFFKPEVVISNIDDAVDEVFANLKSTSTWIVNNLYYLAIQSQYNKQILQNKLKYLDNDFYYILQDLDLIDKLTKSINEYDSFSKILSNVKYSPHKEIIASQVLINAKKNQTEIFKIIRKFVAKNNETDRNILNRIVLSLGVALKDYKLIQNARKLELIEAFTHYNNKDQTSIINNLFNLNIKKSLELLILNHKKIFDGEINDSIVSMYFNNLNQSELNFLVNNLHDYTSNISDEFDCYNLRLSILKIEYKYSKSFELDKWIKRINSYSNPYWKGFANSEIINYLLLNNEFKFAVDIYKSFQLDPDLNNYPQTRAWQYIVRNLIHNRNFDLAVFWFNELKIFPNSEFFPSEDEFKCQIFVSPFNNDNFSSIKDFFRMKYSELNFIDLSMKSQIKSIIDFINGEYPFLEFLESYKSILENWYKFDIDEIFELAICNGNRFEILKKLNKSNLNKRDYYINLLFKNIKRQDVIKHSLFEWMFVIPDFSSFYTITSWDNFLQQNK